MLQQQWITLQFIIPSTQFQTRTLHKSIHSYLFIILSTNYLINKIHLFLSFFCLSFFTRSKMVLNTRSRDSSSDEEPVLDVHNLEAATNTQAPSDQEEEVEDELLSASLVTTLEVKTIYQIFFFENNIVNDDMFDRIMVLVFRISKSFNLLDFTLLTRSLTHPREHYLA